MKEKKDCKIVQDLLPNYIDNLTTETTNEYIEEHLKECAECSAMLETMQQEIQMDTDKIDKKEINYFKKYNIKLRTLKTVIFVIFLILVLVVGRRMIILATISGKANKSKTTDNYYIRCSAYEGHQMSITENYRKGDKEITIQRYYDNNFHEYNPEVIQVKSKAKVDNYIKMPEGNIAALDINPDLYISTMDVISADTYIDNIWDFIKISLISSVRTVKCNGRDCYYFSNFKKSNNVGSKIGYRILYRQRNRVTCKNSRRNIYK